MEFFGDWKFWITVANFVISLAILAFNYFSHQKIVYNDLSHLSVDVKKIHDVQIEQGKEIHRIDKKTDVLKEQTKNLEEIVKSVREDK